MNSLRKIGLTALYLAAAEATASTGTAGAAPSSNVEGVTATDKPKRAPKNPDNILDIINGRLPLALVYLIRFKDTALSVADAAKKYGTSVGKVFDIKKNRNFAYVNEAYKPSAEEVSLANAWCDSGKTAKGKSLKEAGGDPDGIKTMVSALGVATADEVAARNWQVKVVGAKAPAAEGTAPVAGETKGKATGAAAPAAGTGAKLF